MMNKIDFSGLPGSWILLIRPLLLKRSLGQVLFLLEDLGYKPDLRWIWAGSDIQTYIFLKQEPMIDLVNPTDGFVDESCKLADLLGDDASALTILSSGFFS